MTDVAKLAPDLEAARDAKVFPVARAVLADMAELLIPEDANEKVDYNPIVLKTLQRSLDADFNITMEAQYLFQLILGVFSGLNVTVQGVLNEAKPLDDVRYGNIARRILKSVADANVTLGGVTQEQTITDFAPVQAVIKQIFAEEQLTRLEVKYIMDNLFESFNTVNNAYSAQLERSTADAECKVLGINDMSELTLGRVDEILKQPVIKASDLEGPGADEQAPL